MPNRTKDKYLVVKGLAGMGNRMLSALTGILYARLSGRRLIIDWSDLTYSNDGSNAFHCYFQCSLCDPADEIPITDSVCPAAWRGHLDKSAATMRTPYRNITEFRQNTSIDLKKLDYQEDVLVMWTFDGDVELLRNHFTGAFGEFSNMSKDEILKKLLREDLLPHSRIKNMVDEFRRERFRGKTVGVHVRYSDHRTRLLAILNKLSTLRKIENGLQIFLATDNIQIKRLFEENYPDVITTQHWYPKPGSRIHDNRACPDQLASGVDALVDLYLLSECDYLIIDTSSTFSKVACLLTTTPESNIHDLGRGDKPPPFVRRITWRTMLRIGFYSWGLNILSKIQRTKNFLSDD